MSGQGEHLNRYLVRGIDAAGNFVPLRVQSDGTLITDTELTVGSGLEVDIAEVGGVATATNAGIATAGTLRVIEANDSALTSGVENIVAAVEIMDDWDESDRVKVNPVVGQAGVAANAGIADATTQRFTQATDDAVPSIFGTPLVADASTVAFSAACAEQVLDSGVTYIILGTEDCHFGINNAVGTHATTTNFLLRADREFAFRTGAVNATLHVIRDSADGTLYVQKMS